MIFFFVGTVPRSASGSVGGLRISMVCAAPRAQGPEASGRGRGTLEGAAIGAAAGCQLRLQAAKGPWFDFWLQCQLDVSEIALLPRKKRDALGES